MPLQNRVTPTGDIIAIDARGTLMGNRGEIHDSDTKTLLKRRWMHQRWVWCQLDFQGRKQTIMGRGRYTKLFIPRRSERARSGTATGRTRFAKRTAGDVEAGGGRGAMELTGASGKYADISGTRENDVDYLEGKWLVLMADCTWQRP